MINSTFIYVFVARRVRVFARLGLFITPGSLSRLSSLFSLSLSLSLSLFARVRVLCVSLFNAFPLRRYAFEAMKP